MSFIDTYSLNTKLISIHYHDNFDCYSGVPEVKFLNLVIVREAELLRKLLDSLIRKLEIAAKTSWYPLPTLQVC